MEVRAEIFGERIAVVPQPRTRFPGDYEMSKAVPGGNWNKDQHFWHYPLTLSTCRILRSVYTDMLVVGPELKAWARAEIAKTSYMKDLAAQQDTTLTRVPEAAPLIDAAMSTRTYQRVGAKFLALNRFVLLADEPTLGKTIQYLGGLVEGDNERGMHLIIAPKSSLYSVWAQEIFKWTDYHPFWMPDGREKRQRRLDMFLADEKESKFLIINPEMLQTLIAGWCRKCEMWEPTKAEDKARRGKAWFPMTHYTDGHESKPKIKKQDWPELFQIEWNSICIDEAHLSLLGNRSATQKTQAAEGLTRLRLAANGMRIGSTGTPLKGKAMSFWSIFNWLRPDVYKGKWAWAESFLEIEKQQFGTKIGDVRADREAALYESLASIMLRRTKREVQPDLPEDLTLDHWVELEGNHAKQYLDMVSEGEAEIQGGALSAQGVLAEFTRQKQFAFGAWEQYQGKLQPWEGQSPKEDLLYLLLEKRGVTGDPKTEFRLEGGFKYIVASQFTDIIDYLEGVMNRKGIQTLKITGAVTGPKRDAAVASWQNDADGPRVLLMSTKAGGTALTLDAMCDEMFILDETWVHDEQFQLEGRIRNRDVEKRVAVRSFHYIRTRGTVEEEIAESGLSQDEFQKTLLDRSRGRDIKRRRIQK